MAAQVAGFCLVGDVGLGAVWAAHSLWHWAVCPCGNLCHVWFRRSRPEAAPAVSPGGFQRYFNLVRSCVSHRLPRLTGKHPDVQDPRRPHGGTGRRQPRYVQRRHGQFGQRAGWRYARLRLPQPLDAQPRVRRSHAIFLDVLRVLYLGFRTFNCGLGGLGCAADRFSAAGCSRRIDYRAVVLVVQWPPHQDLPAIDRRRCECAGHHVFGHLVGAAARGDFPWCGDIHHPVFAQGEPALSHRI